VINDVNRRQALALLGILLTVAPQAGAQQLRVVGFLSSRSADESAPFVAAFREGLQQAGFLEGRNLRIEYRWAENRYDRLPAMAAELVGHNVAVIVAAGGTVSAFAAKDATSTVPIVFTSAGNPVEIGLVASLNRPGGNLTGVDATLTTELDAKRLELLRDLLAGSRAVGALVNPNRPHADSQVNQIEAAAHTLGMRVTVLKASSEAELDTAIAELVRQRLGGLMIGADPLFISQREQIIALAAKHLIPTIYGWRDFVASGGLMSYGANLAGAYRQAGAYTGRILNGAKPADLPVEQPIKFELVLNLKTARALGLNVPPSILARADEVIE
jgi:putative tryptophan/tyrosine transport system substrate-binding protein